MGDAAPAVSHIPSQRDQDALVLWFSLTVLSVAFVVFAIRTWHRPRARTQGSSGCVSCRCFVPNIGRQSRGVRPNFDHLGRGGHAVYPCRMMIAQGIAEPRRLGGYTWLHPRENQFPLEPGLKFELALRSHRDHRESTNTELQQFRFGRQQDRPPNDRHHKGMFHVVLPGCSALIVLHDRSS